ncbi:septum formation initiator family protein [Porticoccaceae bacterium]|jgi:cell division protein FtsB|nr:septum formation initiator family protein [Porticoccaceae bacterium]MDB9842996.1 septum formation initiator family protein [Porticoccaceae bacterium]MDC0133592.1 septum formation initiator family protein [Porticoccaceae bacterium]MDC1476683.1 septum formation initiator family protein [Porticoccaceae bacterium]CAI8384597.1 MAG: Cell division protein FtsB [SAR92 bacterium MED-G29]|tara:strand:+ start:5077 stop:5403 length:327 start_codon:yes stop_codon:yes gene_type:complete
MRWLLIILVVLLIGLQTRLWVGEGSLAHRAVLDRELELQAQKNLQLKQRNDIIAKEVESLKANLDSIEEKARKDLGMIKQGEIFYLVIDKDDSVLNSKSDAIPVSVKP